MAPIHHKTYFSESKLSVKLRQLWFLNMAEHVFDQKSIYPKPLLFVKLHVNPHLGYQRHNPNKARDSASALFWIQMFSCQRMQTHWWEIEGGSQLLKQLKVHAPLIWISSTISKNDNHAWRLSIFTHISRITGNAQQGQSLGTKKRNNCFGWGTIVRAIFTFLTSKYQLYYTDFIIIRHALFTIW